MKVTCMMCNRSHDVPQDIDMESACVLCGDCFDIIREQVKDKFHFVDDDLCECNACQMRRAVEALPDSDDFIVADWSEC